MTEQAALPPVGAGKSATSAPLIFGITVFASAMLIFLVEPMIAKMVLPTLGGSPMVWNTCMAFFQFALLIGYLYAHLLQRVKALRTQVLIHAIVLIVAMMVLPLRVSQLMGPEPGTMAPGLWLVGVLALSLLPPFAALSATAPLAQAWYARVRSGEGDAVNPYVLYAASNLGSFIALIAYPTLVEPIFSLQLQKSVWSLGYITFVILMCVAAYMTAKAKGATPRLADVVEQETLSKTITWKDRLMWIGLAAAPSSLMLGVTTHITTDVASAPFLWVAPLALYLITFIMAFASKPVIQPYNMLTLQAGFAIVVAYLFSMRLNNNLLVEVVAHLIGFFFTALMCHSILAWHRPHPSKLTEFYLLMAVGGVIGGAFNAFVAPLMLNGVWEYPIVLVLACLARPWGDGKLGIVDYILIAIGAFAFFALDVLALFYANLPVALSGLLSTGWTITLPGGTELNLALLNLAMATGAVCTFLSRGRGLIFTVLLAMMITTPMIVGRDNTVLYQDRSFFGVLRVSEQPVLNFSDRVRTLAHGTTLHGAQSQEEETRCLPLVYYAPATPIGQVFDQYHQTKPAITVGAVGMGTGTVATYTRPGDALRFYEIDQNVIDMASNPEYFSYINGCAEGKVDWVLGDARLSLEKEPPAKFDILLVDAFSSDAVPAHLLTVEAMRTYLNVIKPDGVIIMHLSNRHLALSAPVEAVAAAAGGFSLHQFHYPSPDAPQFVDTGEEAVIVGHSPAGIAAFVNDTRWEGAAPGRTRAWTDDYTNLFGAMIASMRERPGPLGAALRAISGED